MARTSTKDQSKEKLSTILLNREIVERIKIRAAVEGTTIKELTERILGEACPPASSWTIKK